jgi:dolichol-phosphate mannosyltransferase
MDELITNELLANPWVVVPTYNEAANVVPMADALLALDLPGLRILFVDDASPDGTGDLIDELTKAHPGRVHGLHRRGDRGLGRSYLDGFRWVLEGEATAVVQMDCDFSHRPQDLPRLLAALSEADFVIGSRYVEGGAVDPSWGMDRKALSAWGNFYSRAILGIREVADITAGFRAWRRPTLSAVTSQPIGSQGYIFQVEMTYVALRLGFRPLEVPIFFPDRRSGESKMTMKVKVEAALRAWEVRWRHRKLRPLDRTPA